MLRALGAVAAGAVAVGAYNYFKEAPVKSKEDPVKASIDKWTHEEAAGENRLEVGNTIKDAYDREVAMLAIHAPEITTLPELLPTHLKILDVSECAHLQALPKTLPATLEVLNLFKCDQLTTLPEVPPNTVIIAPSHLITERFEHKIDQCTLPMRAVVQMARDGTIPGGPEGCVSIEEMSCPIGYAELATEMVILVAHSSCGFAGKTVCTLYDANSYKCLPADDQGRRKNPLTGDPLMSVDIRDVYLDLEHKVLSYNHEKSNFELDRGLPHLGIADELASNTKQQIYKMAMDVGVEGVSNVFREMEFLDETGSAHQGDKVSVATALAKMVVMTRPL